MSVCGLLLLFGFASTVHADERARVISPAPIFVAPGAAQPLVVAQAGTLLEVIRTEGPWLNVAFKDERYGRRIGYIQAKYVRLDDSPSPSVTPPPTSELLKLSNPPPTTASPITALQSSLAGDPAFPDTPSGLVIVTAAPAAVKRSNSEPISLR